MVDYATTSEEEQGYLSSFGGFTQRLDTTMNI